MKQSAIGQAGLAVLFGTVLSLLSCLLLTFFLSLAVSAGAIELQTVPLLLCLLCVVSALLGGRLAVQQGSGQAIWLGLATGVALCIVLLLVCLLCYGEPNWQEGRILLSMGLGGSCAGLFGRQNKKRKKKK